MKLVSAIPIIGELARLMAELSDNVRGAGDEKALAAVEALAVVAAEVVAVSNLITVAANEGREEFTPTEKASVRRAADQGRALLVAAIQRAGG